MKILSKVSRGWALVIEIPLCRDKTKDSSSYPSRSWGIGSVYDRCIFEPASRIAFDAHRTWLCSKKYWIRLTQLFQFAIHKTIDRRFAETLNSRVIISFTNLFFFLFIDRYSLFWISTLIVYLRFVFTIRYNAISLICSVTCLVCRKLIH